MHTRACLTTGICGRSHRRQTVEELVGCKALVDASPRSGERGYDYQTHSSPRSASPRFFRPGRRGTIFIVVLATSLVVSVLALGALTVRRVERRRLRDHADLAAARLYAQAAVEMALLRTASDSNWRQSMASGTWETDQPIGQGFYSFSASDPDDGDLTDAPDDPVVIVATGKSGPAVQRLQVTLVPDSLGLSCLEVSLHAGDDLEFTGGLVSDQIISTNKDATQSGSDPIVADVEAVKKISLNNHTGSTTEGISPRVLPDVNTVFDYYIDHATANGTLLSISQIPEEEGEGEEEEDGDGRHYIEEVVLSPQSNPYGAGNTSPEGIYVVDCQGQIIIVRDVRIVGTLVLLDPNSNSRISGQLNWQPAVANYPALMVRGSMQLRFTGDPLDEGAEGVNFNPAGTPYPYPDGTSDTDQSDSYPSVLKGLVYVSDYLTADGSSSISGSVVAGTKFTASEPQALTLTYDGVYLNDPPPGFVAQIKMKIDPATWQQVVD